MAETQTRKTIDLTPYTAKCLKEAGLNTERITALFLMRRLDLLKEIDGITDKTVYKLRVLLSPEGPTAWDYSWVYHLALSVFFGEFGLSALLYAEPNSAPLIDRVIMATPGTEEVTLSYLRATLKTNEREIVEAVFRKGETIPSIAKRRRLTEVRVRQIYHQAMAKLSDEDEGIANDLLGLVFRCPDDEAAAD